MQRWLSLGFSCQTRFSVDTLAADPRRHPFDWTITTREGLMQALRSEGASFAHEAETLARFRMPIEGREGLTGNGIYFWHDYPYRKRNLARDWREHVAQVNGKYAALWPRFLRLLRDPAVHKRLLVSNTQDNLAEFAEGERDFAARFGLTAGFAEELRGCLNSIGACNFSLLFLNRSLYDSFSLAQIPGAPAASRYWGPTGLPTSGFLAAATLLPRVPPAEAEAALRRLVGPWEEGCSIGLCGGLGYVFREGALWAEVAVIEDGYVFVFAGAGGERHRSAILDGEELVFSDRRRWRRGG